MRREKGSNTHPGSNTSKKPRSPKGAGEGCSPVLFATQPSGMVTPDFYLVGLGFGGIPLPSKPLDAFKGVDQSPVMGQQPATPSSGHAHVGLANHLSSSSQLAYRLGLGQREGAWQGSRCSLEDLALAVQPLQPMLCYQGPSASICQFQKPVHLGKEASGSTTSGS